MTALSGEVTTSGTQNVVSSSANGYLAETTPEYAAMSEEIRKKFSVLQQAPDQATLLAWGRADPGNTYDHRGVVTEFLKFPARDGAEIELKVYRAENVQKDATLIVRMHGGGWVMGCHETDGEENARAAETGKIVVASVDYRMAPEHPFPKPLEDSFDALIWCKKNADKLGVNPEKIILAGSSAGANLAAALTLLARDAGITGILAQVLHFPLTCHSRFYPHDKYELLSLALDKDRSVVDAERVSQFWGLYLANQPPKPDWRHSPLLAESLQNLPKTLVQCGGLDPIRDEGIAYTKAMKDAGVDVEHHSHVGVPHCFPGVAPTLKESAIFYEKYISFLERVLAN